MKTFREFILEVMNSNFDYKYDGTRIKDEHSYTFSPSDEDNPISVKIKHHDNRNAEVKFAKVGDNDHWLSGEHPTKSSKIMGTVSKIMRDHAQKHGDKIDNYTFSASNIEPSRVRLYHHLAKKSGGNIDTTRSDKRFTVFNVPIKNV